MGFDDSFKMIHSSMVHLQVGRGDLQGFNGIPWNMMEYDWRYPPVSSNWLDNHPLPWLTGGYYPEMMIEENCYDDIFLVGIKGLL